MDGAIGVLGHESDAWPVVAEVWPDHEPTVRVLKDGPQAAARVRLALQQPGMRAQRFATEAAAYRWLAVVALQIEYRARLRCLYDRCTCGQEFAGYERTLHGVFDSETKARARALEQGTPGWTTGRNDAR